jgi:hypothetical protein
MMVVEVALMRKHMEVNPVGEREDQMVIRIPTHG